MAYDVSLGRNRELSRTDKCETSGNVEDESNQDGIKSTITVNPDNSYWRLEI